MSSLLSGIDTPTQLRALAESQLPLLCEELRAAIISVCGQVGGHLGASLGAVELTVALHRVFHSPQDALVFDVGHQAYAHKLLTGRRDRMSTLRQAGGIAPFLDPRESPHDAVGAGHACTAVSTALGLAEGRRLQQRKGHVVAIVGDGALTGGLSFEGLNNLGGRRDPMVVVVNDNQMSISANVGAVPALLRTRQARAFFEALGLSYVGPIEGHSLPALLEAFREARRAFKPVVVHVVTQKGRGFLPAEKDTLTRGHAMGPYELRAGKLVRSRGGQKTFSEAFASELDAVMVKDERVVVVTPAMVEGSALGSLKTRWPERVFDVGIAEQHAVSFAAGLAKAGLRPVVCIYSTFLQRAVDQVIHDVCLPGLPVLFAIDRAGLVGADGATHQGAYDLAQLRPIPGLTLMAPTAGEDLAGMVATALAIDGPSAIRFPRGTLPSLPKELHPAPGPVKGARWLKRASQPSLCFITLGPLGLTALEASKGEEDYSVLDARWVSPLDEEAVVEALRSGRVLVVEEGTTRGGLGSAVLELMAARGLSAKVQRVGLPDAFIPHGDARQQRVELGLDAAGLKARAQAMLTATP